MRGKLYPADILERRPYIRLHVRALGLSKLVYGLGVDHLHMLLSDIGLYIGHLHSADLWGRIWDGFAGAYYQYRTASICPGPALQFK